MVAPLVEERRTDLGVGGWGIIIIVSWTVVGSVMSILVLARYF